MPAKTVAVFVLVTSITPAFAGDPFSIDSLCNNNAEHSNKMARQTDKASQEKNIKIESIEINSNPIFNPDDPETTSFHDFVNWLHIETRDATIASQLPFQAGDLVSEADILEAEPGSCVLKNTSERRKLTMPNHAAVPSHRKYQCKRGTPGVCCPV